MSARVSELDDSPFPTLANDNILNLAKSVWERFAPSIVVSLVRFLSHQLFVPCNILELTILGDDLRSSVWVPHVPRFVKLPDNFFGGVHGLFSSPDALQEYVWSRSKP
jgi:hypothetical protein